MMDMFEEWRVLDHSTRRQRLFDDLDKDSVAVIFAADLVYRNADTAYPYRQNSYFWYLTGFPEPDAALVLIGESRQAILFCREKNPDKEIWDGFRYGPAAAADRFAMDAAYPIEQIKTLLPKYLKGKRVLLTPWQQSHHADWLLTLWQEIKSAQGSVPAHYQDLRPLLDNMRLIKDASERALLRRAAAISAQGHLAAMRAAKTAKYEYELEAELEHVFIRSGARSPAYSHIVASGANACILHYVTNRSPLQPGSLVMIDAGAEYGGYAGDISRTFPVNGCFSSAQKALYETVLSVNERLIAACKIGVTYAAVSEMAIRLLSAGLIELGLLKGSVDAVVEQGLYRRFYMHGFGHWLGLDVHDVGGRVDHQGQSLRLQQHMAMTVEPGLYIPDADDIPAYWRGVGVRIEDNIFIGKDGAEVYSNAVPKTVTEIEAWMNHD